MRYSIKKAKARFNISRRRRRRGHGVHSPFVYGLAREIFRKRRLPMVDSEFFYVTVAQSGASDRVIEELYAIYLRCKLGSLTVTKSTSGKMGYTDRMLHVIATPELGTLPHTEGWKEGDYRVLAVLEPHINAERESFCKNLIESGECVSIDRFDYMLFFYDSKLTPQHFEL